MQILLQSARLAPYKLHITGTTPIRCFLYLFFYFITLISNGPVTFGAFSRKDAIKSGALVILTLTSVLWLYSKHRLGGLILLLMLTLGAQRGVEAERGSAKFCIRFILYHERVYSPERSSLARRDPQIHFMSDTAFVFDRSSLILAEP
ncbi:hypothetical protein DFH11DRAFT_177863 [Phellopilus nigrolimitatus]|nr:hypothetical protein DFH11DRAFT_177863 [Phellopilus nigrolimitatus]